MEEIDQSYDYIYMSISICTDNLVHERGPNNSVLFIISFT